MKKPNRKLILRQIKLEVRNRKNFKKVVLDTSSNRTKQVIIQFPECISIVNKKFRSQLLDALKSIHSRDVHKESIILDFRNVKILYPDGAIYLIHRLDKIYNKELVRGRSSYTPTVRAMLSKLGIHKLMKIKEYKTVN